MNLLQMKRTNSQSGIVAVEFALLSWLLFAIIFAIINLSILLFDKAVITNAAREGARWASIHSSSGTCSTNTITTTDPCGIANGYAKQYLISFAAVTASPSTSFTSAGYSTGALQTITVTYNFTGTGIDFMKAFFNNISPQIIGVSSMYHE
jgi:Flp pilus assembly protein TadG